MSKTLLPDGGLFSPEQLARVEKKFEDQSLRERYIVPPFSVISRMSWAARDRDWKRLGIKSELGREGKLTFTTDIFSYYGKRAEDAPAVTTSVFSPTLVEILLDWFCPKGGRVLDPFAGGSVRGVVTEYLGYHYTGIDISARQIASNEEQATAIGVSPIWLVGGSQHMDELLPEDYKADFMLTCPPYGALEVYSDNPEDISNMPHETFLEEYEVILQKAYDRLEDNSFAVVVIGDLRGKDGYYLGLPAQTIALAQRIGFGLYNDLILHQPIGSAALRANSYFKNRKMPRIHEHVLVFGKGNWKKAVNKLKDGDED